jgi:hypothetical protein
MLELAGFRYKNCLSIIRKLRSYFSGEGDLIWRSEAIKIYQENSLTPTLFSQKIKAYKANKVLVEK